MSSKGMTLWTNGLQLWIEHGFVWIINGPQKYKRGHEQQRDDYID